uniref:Putative glycosyltransferase n=1 Tax=viral metagenome TaxID=1070528 RepID=A0A6M3M707_9ZZZZ
MLNEIRYLVENKTVVLVGNSNTVFDNPAYKTIEQYDVIVRMNHGHRPGERTDIWLCAMCNPTPQKDFYQKFGAVINIRLNNDGRLCKELQGKVYEWARYETWRDNYKNVNGAMPSTGLNAIQFFLLETNPKKLYIIGYDHFETKSWYNQKPDEWHNGNAEKSIVSILEKEGKICRL